MDIEEARKIILDNEEYADKLAYVLYELQTQTQKESAMYYNGLQKTELGKAVWNYYIPEILKIFQ